MTIAAVMFGVGSYFVGMLVSWAMTKQELNSLRMIIRQHANRKNSNTVICVKALRAIRDLPDVAYLSGIKAIRGSVNTIIDGAIKELTSD